MYLNILFDIANIIFTYMYRHIDTQTDRQIGRQAGRKTHIQKDADRQEGRHKRQERKAGTTGRQAGRHTDPPAITTAPLKNFNRNR
jgi:hypothetical protein